MGDAMLRLQKRIVASPVMPHKRDGKSAVISADGLNGDGTFAVMVKAEVHRRQNAVIVFPDGRCDGDLPSLRILLPPPTTTFNAQNGTFSWAIFKNFVPLGQIKKPVHQNQPQRRFSSR